VGKEVIDMALVLPPERRLSRRERMEIVARLWVL
jgi:hypothetical protein